MRVFNPVTNEPNKLKSLFYPSCVALDVTGQGNLPIQDYYKAEKQIKSNK